MTASADKVLANASTLRAVGSARRTRRLRPCGLSSLGILDTDRNASQDMTRLGLESRRRADLPPSARHATDRLNQHHAIAPYCTNSNIVENRVSVAKRQSERLSERPRPNTPSPSFAISLHIRGCGDCPRIADGRDPALARRARRLAHKSGFGDCPRTPLRDERGGWRTRGLFQLAAVREATVRNQWRTPRHDRLSEATCLGVRGAAILKKPVWASRRLARRVPLPRFEPHIDKAGRPSTSASSRLASRAISISPSAGAPGGKTTTTTNK